MINHITKTFNERLSEKQRQWVWFVLLWFVGLLSVVTLGTVIKLIMRI